MASALKVENQDNAVLAGLSPDSREKLRRIVLVSTEDDWTISQKVQGNCSSMHVQAMRRRLRSLGVLPQVVAENKPRYVRKPKPDPKTKYINRELFEGDTP